MADKYVVSFNSDTSDSEEEEDETTETESESNDVTEVSFSLPREQSPEPAVEPLAETTCADFTLDFSFAKDNAEDENTFTFDLGMTNKDDDEQPVTTSGEITEGANDLVDSSAASVQPQLLGDIKLAEQENNLDTAAATFDSEAMKDLDTTSDTLNGTTHTHQTSDDLITFDSLNDDKVQVECDNTEEISSKVMELTQDDVNINSLQDSAEGKEGILNDTNTSAEIEEHEPIVEGGALLTEPSSDQDCNPSADVGLNVDELTKPSKPSLDLDKEPRSPPNRIRILSDEALGSPTRKSTADDDDFEARISRAKAFIESTKRGDDVSSSAASERDESDQYILGTCAITTGDINADEVYTEEDTQAVRPRKKYSFEPPDLVRKSRSMDEPKKSLGEPKRSLDETTKRRRRTSGRDPYDPENTDELIKRIMAEARGESYVPPEPEEVEGDYDGDDLGYVGSFSDSSYQRTDDASTSLLERRIQAMKQRNAELAADNFDPRPSQARRRNSFTDQDRQLTLYQHDDDTASVASSVRRPQSARTSWRKHQQNGFDDDDDVFTDPAAGALVPYVPPEEEEESDPDEDPIYKTRRALRKRFALPDSAFQPQKSEDTDDIVKEKTAGIRSVIAKQEDILQDLRKASQSFDDVDDEIKQIREQFYESQERRAILQEEIEFDLENMKKREEEQAALAYARKYAPLPTVDYTKGYIPTHAPKALGWEQEAESDEEDPIAPYNKRCLALTYNGWAGGSQIGQMDLTRDCDLESTASMPAYRPYSAHGRQPRSMYDRNKARLMMEDHDSEINDAASSRMSVDDEELEQRRFQPNREQKKPGKFGINLSEVDHEMEELSAKINSWRAKMSSDALINGDEAAPKPNHDDAEPLTNGVDADSSDSGAYSNGSRQNENGHAVDHIEMNGVRNGYGVGTEGEEKTGYSWRRGRASSVAPETTSSSWRKDPSDWRSRLSASTQDSLKKYSSVDTDSYRPKYGSYSKTPSTDNHDYSSYTSQMRSNRYTSSTLSDYQPPIRNRTRARSCEPTGFRSKFLDKVREKKSTGEGTDKREKPFKSRFLKSSTAVSAEA
ncbi:hypothetical protein CAPTEDRAFT_221049 [Capitella teleta]|uniref:Uncharacterized protein n=1 Tax=Capitella teleta TaxID=283909 RepID=R7UEJ1_CAPTE|nr:hypothetical protein CAPTEDRAFT_221049 [Capitella teleta]|eukprot:ELU04496.1 hypothetical protein CAPTEDRAFT_221049 [Capitella teleta]